MSRPSVPLTVPGSRDSVTAPDSLNTSSLPLDPVRANVPRPEVGMEYGGQSSSPMDSSINQSNLHMDVPRPEMGISKPSVFDTPETAQDIIPMNATMDKMFVDLIKKTAESVGPIPVQGNIVTVTQDSLKSQSKPSGKYSLVIDPNENIARLEDSNGVIIKQFNVGTGDTTGVRYGKKYFTPTGKFEIDEKVRESEGLKKYGPYWMQFKRAEHGDYGLHGPYEDPEKVVIDDKFINGGFVSHGCVRVQSEDLKEIAKYLKLGSKVTVLPYRIKPSADYISNELE